MYLEFEVKNSILIVNMSGELDHNSAEQLRIKVDDKIEDKGLNKVILNFKGITFMDSSGIGAVIGRYKKVKVRGGSLVVSNVNKNVNRIFEIAGLYKIIQKYNTVKEAAACI